MPAPADHSADTIVAIATPPGAGGVGIVRVSGPGSAAIAGALCGFVPPVRRVRHARFVDAAGETIDDGIVLRFAAPASFTGEDVAEFQAHGSPAVLQALVARCCTLGARMARPGEYSERAFVNGKLDLAQAEAVADLIAAGDLVAARAARRALDGVFSQRVDAIADELLALRVHVEAMIDFADEPLETLGMDAVQARLARMRDALAALRDAAHGGCKLRDGMHAVIVGPPNAGKSSLLNALAGSERAIVTDVAGTTRDLLRETVRVDGLELTLVDTAGLHAGGDSIEREGMRRARMELERAELAIVVLDARDPAAGREEAAAAAAQATATLWVHNKADLLPDDAPPAAAGVLRISARRGDGLAGLHAALREQAFGAAGEGSEGAFTARARHVQALDRAAAELEAADEALRRQALDLAAEALRGSHDALGEITGKVAPDALLGHIFSTFCIGK
ncbi:tRNA uridine-5-carboxymethylaminomethyl(34) synthesis GTPase MnmE [Luteimonas vadosa]|uniref:tRNA modification GTPase MnmE n=1 Tax=Luteimonas vadosa TaxID=1165507 RepID=A0ABP9DW62_9GAMM